MEYIILCILVSAGVSALVAKAIADYHFRVIDSYVNDMVEIAKKEIQKAHINQGKR